jgi:hypothetical protein
MCFYIQELFSMTLVNMQPPKKEIFFFLSSWHASCLALQGFFFKFPSVYKLATHMLGGGGTIDNQCDFFISEVGTLHYFELGS